MLHLSAAALARLSNFRTHCDPPVKRFASAWTRTMTTTCPQDGSFSTKWRKRNLNEKKSFQERRYQMKRNCAHLFLNEACCCWATMCPRFFLSIANNHSTAKQAWECHRSHCFNGTSIILRVMAKWIALMQQPATADWGCWRNLTENQTYQICCSANLPKHSNIFNSLRLLCSYILCCDSSQRFLTEIQPAK